MNGSGGAPELRLFDALFRLNKFVLADARTHITAAADLDLGDFLTLRSIELGVDTPGGLARDLGLNPAVVSRALTKLMKAGLIERRIDSGGPGWNSPKHDCAPTPQSPRGYDPASPNASSA